MKPNKRLKMWPFITAALFYAGLFTVEIMEGRWLLAFSYFILVPLLLYTGIGWAALMPKYRHEDFIKHGLETIGMAKALEHFENGGDVDGLKAKLRLEMSYKRKELRASTMLYKEVCDRLAEIRDEYGLTNAEMDFLLGFTTNGTTRVKAMGRTYHFVTYGQNVPIYYMVRLRAKLGVNLDWLITGEGEKLIEKKEIENEINTLRG